MRSRIPIWFLGVVKTTVLAVIFRPAVLSHPDYELQPEEHKLGQEVLEFLIVHQDWSTPAVPPPPSTGEGWKLIGKVGQLGIPSITMIGSHSSKSPHPPHREFSS